MRRAGKWEMAGADDMGEDGEGTMEEGWRMHRVVSDADLSVELNE